MYKRYLKIITKKKHSFEPLQKETLVLYTTSADESSWVEDIQSACAKLKKNRATLKRESNQFEPLRKPDIIKMRRESLSKIMLMRRCRDFFLFYGKENKNL